MSLPEVFRWFGCRDEILLSIALAHLRTATDHEGRLLEVIDDRSPATCLGKGVRLQNGSHRPALEYRLVTFFSADLSLLHAVHALMDSALATDVLAGVSGVF